jgi:hypothetical protein
MKAPMLVWCAAFPPLAALADATYSTKTLNPEAAPRAAGIAAVRDDIEF